MVRKADFEEWLLNPVTKEFLEQLRESRDESSIALSSKLLSEEDSYLYSEKGKAELLGFKSQVQVLSMILEIEDFMVFKIEKEKKEEKRDEDETTGSGR